MKSRSRDLLIKVIDREIQSPDSLATVLEELKEGDADQAFLLRFLEAKDFQYRHVFYLKSQHVWYRRFGWKIMRPLFLVAILGAVVFSLQRAFEPTLAAAIFIAGAAATYVTIQIFAHRWALRELTKLSEINDDYRDKLRGLRREISGSTR